MSNPKIPMGEKDEAIKRYLSGDIDYLIGTYGFPNKSAVNASMRQRFGVMISEQPQEEELERHPIVELPPIKLLKWKAPRIRGDEEEAILHCGDGHGGKITRSFNDSVYRSRMGKMFESVMKIVTLHRNMYPIRKLHIVNDGDNSQGENPFQGSVIGEVSMGARDQIKKLVAPMWNDVLGSFAQEFEEVEMDCLPGNHGYENLACKTSRSDMVLYDILEVGIGREKNIKINIHEDWACIVDIFGFKIFGFHGDGIPCQQGVPFFALDKKLKSWYMQYGGFNYALGGHFHKRHSDEISSRLEYFMCSTLVSDDDWALKKLGISSNPSQSIYGIHPKYGITWRYPVVVDDKFLPSKLASDTVI